MTQDNDGTGYGDDATGSTSGTRRQYLATVGAGTAALLAGCRGGGGTGPATAGGDDPTATDAAATATDATGTASATALPAVPSGPCQQPPTGSTTAYEGPPQITEDTTIGTDADVVEIDTLLGVRAGATLTVESGTTLSFAQGGSLTVGGTLSASGTCSAPIFFTGRSDARGVWGGITFTGEGSGTLDHVLVENAGSEDGAGVEIRSTGPVAVTNSEIRGSRNFGVSVEQDARLETFGGNGITGNAEPIEVTASNVDAIAGDNALTGNDTDRVFVWASIDYVIPEGEQHTWADPGVPLYLKQNRHTFGVEGDLTLEPGIELRVAQGNGIFVTGSLNAAIPEGDLPAEGAVESPPANAVTIRGAQATPGYWEGLMYSETKDANNVLRGVVVRHAGGEPGGRGIYQEPAGVSVLTGSRLTVDGALIEDNDGYGLFVNKENELQGVERTRIRNNVDPAQVFFTTVPALGTTSSYTGNDTDRIEVINPTNAIETSLTVPAIDAPYRFSLSEVGSLVQIAADVAVADGTEIHFGQGAGIDVIDGGSLAIEGSETGDGGRSTVLRGEEATPGFWKGIRYFDTRSQDNVVDGAEIRHTGASDWANIESPSKAAVAAAVAAEATVRNCLIAEFDGVAFKASGNRPSAGDQTSTITTSNNVVR
ncbi:hypothetical protein [Halosimplex pelagicum]|uniref:Right-handed parallel beta-helix repeat-containing protein n=1 Tax=Halosimplex pelagicum TaxID=869886 RepID=A0A7D5PAC0_9EURY|nr:hypothetical protein [Halosimplex pelagicum]QLH81705.1 hypothetical protein HZS54_08735 [Halosimplex pelagicum]